MPAEAPKENVWAKRKEEMAKVEKPWPDDNEKPRQTSESSTGSEHAVKSVTVSVEQTLNKASEAEQEERLQKPAGFGRGARKGLCSLSCNMSTCFLVIM